MRRAKPSQQGYLDALCGIYSLVNFLRDAKCPQTKRYYLDDELSDEDGRHDREKAAFWHLLETAERLRLLGAAYLTDGYPSHHLITIFNEVCNNLDIPFRGEKFSRLARKGRNLTVFDISKIVIEDGGAVILGDEVHWVLAQSTEGNCLRIEDSAGESSAVRKVGRQGCERFALYEGVALLRQDSAIWLCHDLKQ